MSEKHWVPMTQAAKEVDVPLYKLSRLGSKGRIAVKRDIRNERVRFVDLNEIKTLFALPEREED